MVAEPSPIDQYFIQHPSELFENSVDDSIVDMDNELILEGMKPL
jgi:DEAD/DEAH box helicase domain-containing protein